MSQCIITGCTFRAPDMSWVGGDLHEAGYCWIFNAILHNGEAAWQYGPGSYNDRELIVHPLRNWFERRGVLVVPKDSATLNGAALEYVFGSKT